MILVIGYGNSFCGDDGLGPCAAELLAEKEIPDVQCMAVHQLMPELAAPINLADVVLFVDAAYGATPGEIICREPPPAVSRSLSHYVDPVTLLDAACILYGRRPVAYLYSITGQNFEFGQPFSSAVAAALPRLLCEMKERIAQCTNLASQKA
jgi:hydrogenase maturation protease